MLPFVSGHCNMQDYNTIQPENGMCTYVTLSGGVIESPNYPNDYGNNRNILYIIQAPPNKRITLSFSVLVTEANLDYVYVSFK